MSTQPIETIVTNGGGYPVRIEIVVGPGSICLDHKRLLELEHAIAKARREVLMELPRDRWHEVDPALAGK